jgi:hypothetical protein
LLGMYVSHQLKFYLDLIIAREMEMRKLSGISVCETNRGVRLQLTPG